MHAYIINTINSQIKFLSETALLEYYWFCQYLKLLITYNLSSAIYKRKALTELSKLHTTPRVCEPSR